MQPMILGLRVIVLKYITLHHLHQILVGHLLHPQIVLVNHLFQFQQTDTVKLMPMFGLEMLQEIFRQCILILAKIIILVVNFNYSQA